MKKGPLILVLFFPLETYEGQLVFKLCHREMETPLKSWCRGEALCTESLNGLMKPDVERWDY